MSYYLNLGGWSSVFAVPSSIVDRHLKLAGESQLKVILWALRHGGELFDEERVCAETGVRPENVKEAFDYWISAGVLGTEGNNLAQGSEKPQRAEPVSADSVPQVSPQTLPEKKPESVKDKTDDKGFTPVFDKKPIRPDAIYIAQRMADDKEVNTIMREAEAMLGRMLPPTLSAILINCYDIYDMPPEVIVMMLNYCISQGKTSVHYIEKLAIDWANSGVNSMQAAEEKLQELDRHNIAWKKIVNICGLQFRAATKKETELTYKWIYDLHSPEELIAEAYDRCIGKLGKFSASYMDPILVSWAKNGFISIAQVEEAEAKKKAKQEKPGNTSFDSEFLDTISD
ncbi:MAG: DnaD domain protein [Clostridia bacterium]|nr:DnaD domain protein [Clostridia bacterium]